MNRSELSAVVVAWNAGTSLQTCIDSLRESAERAAVGMQLVIVDNGSSDSALQSVELGEADVLVRNPINAGYGVAAAQGIARASAPWILLLNPDVVVDENFVSELVTAARAAPPRVATLVPEMRFSGRTDLVNCRGLAVDDIGVPLEIDAGAPSPRSAPPSRAALGGSSGCCLLRASAVRELGGPEPAFFAYLEDADLALRLARAGYTALFVPGALAWHEGSAFTGGRSALKAYLVARNRRILFRLHGPRSLRARTRRTVVEIGHGLWSSLHAGTAPWTGRADAVRLRRYVRFVRRARKRAGYETHEPPTPPPRVTLRETLRRKQRIDRVHMGHEARDDRWPQDESQKSSRSSGTRKSP